MKDNYGDKMIFIENIEKFEYENFVKTHEKSHFLQSYAWGEFCKEKNNFFPHYVALKDDNKKILATALLLQKKLPLGYSYFYIPRGFVANYKDTEIIKEFTTHISNYIKKYKGIYFKIDPDIKLQTIDKDANPIPGENNYELVRFLKKIGYKRNKLTYFFESEQPRYTFRINLKDKSEEQIIENYSKTARRFLKKSGNYVIDVGCGEYEDLDDFSRLMVETEKRQNFYSHDSDYYKKFYEYFCKNNNVKLMTAYLDIDKTIKKLEENSNAKEEISFLKEKRENNTPNRILVSSYITVFYGNKAWYLYGANDMNYKFTYANYKLFNYQIMTSVREKKEIFDEFGTVGKPNSSKKVAGLHEFKKKFGGEYTEFIGEFDYVTLPFTYFIFTKLVYFRRKFVKILNRKKVKQKR